MKSTGISSPLFAAPAGVRLLGAQTPPQDPAGSLGGTSWQVVKFQGSDEKGLTPDDKATAGATWKSSGPNQLQFGRLALTHDLPPRSLHDCIAKDWERVRSYTIQDGALFLSLRRTEAFTASGHRRIEVRAGKVTGRAVVSKGPVEYECTQAGGSNDTFIASSYRTEPATVLVERGNQTRHEFQVRIASARNIAGPEWRPGACVGRHRPATSS